MRTLLPCALLFALLAPLPLPAGDTAATAGVTVRDAWARATPPGMTVAAAYLTLSGGPQADRLLGASTPRAAMAELHVVTESDGMSRMRQTDGVEVPAGGTVTLAPQGTHVMLMGLEEPLVAGQQFPLTLQFAAAGTVTVTVVVRAPGESPPPPRP
jgi:periplasmic copper chaperone A